MNNTDDIDNVEDDLVDSSSDRRGETPSSLTFGDTNQLTDRMTRTTTFPTTIPAKPASTDVDSTQVDGLQPSIKWQKEDDIVPHSHKHDDHQEQVPRQLQPEGQHHSKQQQSQHQQQHQRRRQQQPKSEQHSNVNSCRQIICQLDPTVKPDGMFKVISARGKALYTGGFGIPITTEVSSEKVDGDHHHHDHNDIDVSHRPDQNVETNQQNHHHDHHDDHDDDDDEQQHKIQAIATTRKKTNAKVTTTATNDYLFIEEVVFLHERGIVDARIDIDQVTMTELVTTEGGGGGEWGNGGIHNKQSRDISSISNGSKGNTDPTHHNVDHGDTASSTVTRTVSLDLSQLYQLLPRCGISLPIYLTYSHLCGQDFRVFRHNPDRLTLLLRQVEVEEQLKVEQRLNQQEEGKEQANIKSTKNVDAETRIQSLQSTQTNQVVANSTNAVVSELHKDEGMKYCNGDDNDDNDNGDDNNNKIDEMDVANHNYHHPSDHHKRNNGNATEDDDAGMTAVIEDNVTPQPPSGLRPRHSQNHHQQQQEKHEQRQQMTTRQLASQLRKCIRESIYRSPIPCIPQKNRKDSMGCYGDDTIRICWDCYNPNKNFGKTRPGIPDFYVAVAHYNLPLVTFGDISKLIKDSSCYPSPDHPNTATDTSSSSSSLATIMSQSLPSCIPKIPMKIATVSDSGTVVMFGVTDYNIPDNETRTNNHDDCADGDTQQVSQTHTRTLAQ